MTQQEIYNTSKNRKCISINEHTYDSLRNISTMFKGKQSFDSLITELIAYARCKSISTENNKQGAFEL